MTHALRIDLAGDGTLAVTATARAQLPGGPVAGVTLPLSFDPESPAPELKRRKDESDEAYTRRVLKHVPTQLDCDPALAAGLREKLAAILAEVAPVLDHYATRAAAAHALDAEGRVPDDVTKRLRINGKGGTITGGAKPRKG